MENPQIDLHMHSCYSDDGQFTPAELVRACSARGIKVMSIADHNCVRANIEGKLAAEANGIQYISAIEIDCIFQNVNLHILGYGIDYESKDFEDIENHIKQQGMAASQEMLIHTQKLGFPVTAADLMEVSRHNYWKDSWTGEMFAEVLLNHPDYLAHPLLKPYRTGGARGDNPYVNFYWDFYSQGKPCYAKMDYPDLERMIGIIHANHGQAVLAHPGMNLKNQPELLTPIVVAGLDGIEVYSSYHTPEQVDYYFEQANRHQLCYTCGSDYHGKTKPAIQLGAHHCPYSFTEVIKQYQRHSNVADDVIPYLHI